MSFIELIAIIALALASLLAVFTGRKTRSETAEGPTTYITPRSYRSQISDKIETVYTVPPHIRSKIVECSAVNVGDDDATLTIYIVSKDESANRSNMILKDFKVTKGQLVKIDIDNHLLYHEGQIKAISNIDQAINLSIFLQERIEAH
jgi:predicted RNA-binding protein